MQNGDLSNEISPRVYVVFEGTIARPRHEQSRSLRRKLLGTRLSDYETDPVVTMHLWDIWHRMGVRFDTVTFAFAAGEVQRMIDEDENLPVNTAYAFPSRDDFAKQLAFMPWVTHVVDHERPLAYGSRASTLAGLRR